MSLDRLIEIQNKLSLEYSYFPENCCLLASQKVFNEMGYEPKSGVVLTSNGFKKHNWNETSDGKVVDLTLYQFESDYNISVEKIVFMEKVDAFDKYTYFESASKSAKLKKFIEIMNRE